MGHSTLDRVVLVYEDRETGLFPVTLSDIAQSELKRSITTVAEVELLAGAIRASGLQTKVILVSELRSYLLGGRENDASTNEMLWNVTDGDTVFRGAHVPALGAIWNKPYYGSSSYVRGVSTRKHHWKALANEAGIPVTSHVVVRHSNDIDRISELEAPAGYFVKPAQYGNSAGINLINPVVKSVDRASHAATTLIAEGLGPVLVEPFLPGVEIAVAAVHTDSWKFEVFQKSYPGQYLAPEVKDGDQVNKFDAKVVTAPDAVAIALRTIEVIDLKDIFRLDLRFDADGNAMLIDINAGCFLMGSVIRNFIAKQASDFEASLRYCLECSFARQIGKNVKRVEK